MGRAPLRGPRGLLAGALCATGTTWAHVSLSDHPVDGHGPLVLLAVALASVATCLALARRRLGMTGLLAVCGLGQGAAHAAMALAMQEMTGTTHMARTAAHPLTDAGVGMLLAHLAVALVTALLARGGEAVLLDLARQLVERLLPLLPGAWRLPSPVARPAGYVVAPRRGRRVGARVGSRGPPTAAYPRPC